MYILDVKHLKISFQTLMGKVEAVKDVSFHLKEGEVLGIVGESGSGKSVSNLAVMGLLDKRLAKIEDGSVLLDGKELIHLKEKELCKVRGKDIAMIFQEPMTSLNPVVSVYKQLREVIKIHQPERKDDCRDELRGLLERLHIPDADKVLDKYPFELSGGLKQRVMIAMAMVCQPKVLIADEPTTALDVTTQSEILKLLKEIQNGQKMSIIFITHDLGVIAEIADRVEVMYFGKIVEECPVKEFFDRAMHPYSEALLKAMPDHFDGRFSAIEGQVPGAFEKIEGCAYYKRCRYAKDECLKKTPEMVEISPSHYVSCLKYHGMGGNKDAER